MDEHRTQIMFQQKNISFELHTHPEHGQCLFVTYYHYILYMFYTHKMHFLHAFSIRPPLLLFCPLSIYIIFSQLFTLSVLMCSLYIKDITTITYEKISYVLIACSACVYCACKYGKNIYKNHNKATGRGIRPPTMSKDDPKSLAELKVGEVVKLRDIIHDTEFGQIQSYDLLPENRHWKNLWFAKNSDIIIFFERIDKNSNQSNWILKVTAIYRRDR